MNNINVIDFVDAEQIASTSVSERTLTLSPKSTAAEMVLTGQGYKILDDIEDKRYRLIRKMLFELDAMGVKFQDQELNEELNKYQP